MVFKIAVFCKSAFRTSLLLLVSCILVTQVFAEDDLLGSYQLDTIIVTGTPMAAPLSSIAGSVGAVNHEELELVQHSHITESADRISGVWVSRGNGQEHLTAIRSPVFTGPGSCGEFVVLEDGIPTRPAGFCNVNQLFEINSEQAGHIEIFKGPASSLYGSNAVHGVINVLTPSITAKEQSSVMLDGGPHGYARAFLSYSDGKNILINTHGDHDGGYIDDSGFDQQKVNVKFVGDQGNYHVENFIEMTNLNQETAGYLVGPEAYKNDSLRKINYNPGAFRDAQSIHGYSKWISSYGENKELEITPYANASHMEFLQHFVPVAEPLEKNGHESAGLNGRFSYPIFNIGSDILSVHSGFNLETARVYVDEYQSNPSDIPKGYLQGQHYEFNVFMNSLALSSGIEYKIIPSIKLIAGGRYDHQFYDYDNNAPDGDFGRYTRLADRNDEFGNWGFNIGTLWDWTRDHQIYVNTSTGFRAPQVAELYRLEGGTPANAVQSEKIDSVELGMRGTIKPALGDSLYYEVAVFEMYKENVVLKRTDKQYIGDAETSHEGVELTMDYRFLQSAYLKTAITYAEHRYEHVTGQLQYSPNVDLSNNIIDTAPRHYGSLQLGNKFSWGLLEFEIKHIGPYYLNPENTLEYEGHNLLNFRAEWNIATDWKLGARLLNMLNADYAERADATPFSTDPRYFVGEPRALYVSVEKTFQ